MKQPVLYLLVVLALILISSSALAGVTALSLSWWTVDGGGGAATGVGGALSLYGSAGQSDAGTMQGGSFTLAGGFLGGSVPPDQSPHNMFLPLVIR